MDQTLQARLIGAFRWLDPGPHSSHMVSDLSSWWRDPHLLRHLGPALAALFADERPTVVIAPEVTGFLLGPLVANALGVGFVEARKPDPERGNPDRTLWGSAPRDYRGRVLRLGVRAAQLSAADRVLVVDDWAVTGAQVTAVRAAVEQVDARVLGAAVVVDGCAPATARGLGVRGLLRADQLPDHA